MASLTPPSPRSDASADGTPVAAAHPLDRALREHNALLARAGVSLRLERRGERLGLRGPLPCRRGGDRPRVQRLSLGLAADDEGLEQACAALRRVHDALRHNRFAWSQWTAAGSDPAVVAADPPSHTAALRSGLPSGLDRAAAPEAAPSKPLELALQQFERQFQADPRRRRNPSGSRTTWTAAYLPYLRRLRRLAELERLPLGPALLERVLESYPLASRSRQQCGTALAAFARATDQPLPGDWADRAGGYGLHAAQFRQLPSDRQIVEWIERIPNPGWRLAYGLMAAYGLRNHEVFFSDLSALAPGGDRVIRVLPTSKTGEHQVWPFQPDWVERFELERLGEMRELLPPVCTDLRRTTLQQVGRRVAEQFRRYGLPLTPYDLRHAWAVRTIHIGLPDTVAARMMGHSVAIHTRTYHHWITRRDQQQAVDAALARQSERLRSTAA
jgi:hypothetical protein